jgi:fumarate hydratase class I
MEVKLVLKGGGCENVGAQYSLPDARLGASRDLKGVKKCILDTVQQAQGKGCGPGVLGVIIGGDRATGYLASKEQFLRKMRDRNTNPTLAQLEEECLTEANTLGIGPMGFGGKTTLMGVKIGALNRVPASFFVTVSYMCWAYRRQGAKVSGKGQIQKWLY